MRYLVYLLTLFFIGTAIAQSPTIVQGDYITNVFGPSNFVKNPNAQINTANVTVSNATVTRSTTTPLVAKSEFTITTSTATGYADWDLRTFDAGMKNNNCEARFTYRGFTVGSTKAQILQGANVVAELTLVGDANNPKQASINFPCGDLSAVTKFRLQQATASLTGTNEIGGIYIGLATNMANVAQAENVVQASRSTAQAIPTGVATTFVFTSETLDQLDEYNSTTGVFKAKRAGNYLINAGVTWTDIAWTAGQYYAIDAFKNSSSVCSAFNEIEATLTQVKPMQIACAMTLAVGDEITIRVYQNTGTDKNTDNSAVANTFSVYRFPSSSELVVTPERQNVFGGVKYTNQTQSIRTGQAASSTYFEFNNATWNQPTLLIGKAQVTTTGSGNDLGFSIPNLPVGNYKVSIRGLIAADVNGTSVAGHNTLCSFKIRETTIGGTGVDVALQGHRDANPASITTPTRDNINFFFGVFNNTSVATRNFRLEAAKVVDNVTGNGGACQAYSNNSILYSDIVFLLEPLDQPSNSALYVQGPVLGAQTGAAIPEGYVNEFATRSISDTAIRSQSSPTTGTIYYPSSSTLTLPAGNWMVCYTATAEVSMTGSTNNIPYPRLVVQNQTDSTFLIEQAQLPRFTSGEAISNQWYTGSQCAPTAITSSKTFRIGVAYLIVTGTPTVSTLFLRGDLTPTKLYAIRLN